METKPGIRTSEWWLSLAAVLVGFAMSAGVLDLEGGLYKVIAFIGSALTAMGYTVARAGVKRAEALASSEALLIEAPADEDPE